MALAEQTVVMELKKWKFKAHYHENKHTEGCPNEGTEIKDEVLLTDLAKIACFLANEKTGRVAAGLAQLETDLLTLLRSRLQTANRPMGEEQARSAATTYWAGRVSDQQPPKDAAMSGLLDAVLAAKEGTAFKHTANKKSVPLYVNFVQTNEFQAQLRKQFQWKDPGVAYEHGEFTHRIQWYLIIQQGVVTDAAKVFQRVGCYQADVEGQVQGLWQAVFDRGIDPFPSAQDSGDFREPNKLHAHILQNNTSYPLLASFLNARQAKRKAEMVVASGSNLQWSFNYIARKLYNKPTYDALENEEQKTKVKEVVGAMVWER